MSIEIARGDLSPVEVNFKGKNSGVLKYSHKINKQEADEFISSKDKSKNNKFDISEAAKNFFKGVISPITGLIKHPMAGIAMIGGAALACIAVPALGPLMALGFGALGVYQIGKGTASAINNYRKGEYDNAEKSFDKIGQGVIGTLMSILSIKQSTIVAKEAKILNLKNANTLSSEQKAAIIEQTNKQSFIQNLKDITSLITTKQGRASVLAQLKPSAIKAKLVNFKNFITGKKIEKEVEVTRKKLIDAKEKFKKSKEGLRRASLTDKQIELEVTSKYKQVFDELGIPENQRPKLKITEQGDTRGGAYRISHHEIEFNPEAYKAGVFEIDDIIMHEATHCKEALLRASIPQEQVNEIVVEELISRIMKGESEEIIIKGNLFGPDMASPPKLTEGLKKDFVEFAKNDLYQKNDTTEALMRYYEQKTYILKKWENLIDPIKCSKAEREAAPILDKIRLLLKKNPEFVQQYNSQEEAMQALVEYSVSHNTRYRWLINRKIPGVTTEPIEGEELAHAIQSLRNHISTLEGNGRISGLNGIFMDRENFNQYQFSPEEVLAQQKGNSFLIKNLTQKLNEMRQNGTLTAEDEAFMTSLIEKAKNIIEYKTKGLEYYKKYTEMINNPSDKALASTVKAMEEELKIIEAKIKPKEYETITEIIKQYARPDFATPGSADATITALLSRLKQEEA